MLGNYEVSCITHQLQVHCSMACAINLGSSVIISGGANALTSVSQYNEAGWLMDLPELQQRRWWHGCSYYNNNEGTKVGINFLPLPSPPQTPLDLYLFNLAVFFPLYPSPPLRFPSTVS